MFRASQREESNFLVTKQPYALDCAFHSAALARAKVSLSKVGTPQVYPLIWNGQGQTPGQPTPTTPPVWDPLAKPPIPYAANVTNAQEYDIVKDQANPGKTPIETEIDKVQQHNDVACNTLAQKNRKRKQSSIELPFDPTIEEGTVYTLQGFAPNFDGKWLITEVNFTFTGKGGSRLAIELMQCLPTPNKTPGGASAGGGASKSISVPQSPSPKSSLLYDGGINSITPQPANVANLTLSGNETAPTWLNAGGQLNPDQQNLSLSNVGPAG